ncbi:Molybdopterin or thiamine biosynthesis adenylyltransferase [Paracoccus isoporae]|uniref:Molybdopterin or thiamine biosynthesis adenylyltransferase n=1 Tax=Paracoccus isoporae TaxID=591205 RepID=A0A1G7CB72_9RHOB|nr:HesA/MoeB/ThiF family protein [Paracoccus isoporae]SDE36622.1 Molybdopterin or thiamine biosynthesis adenylyltransferase [Paracoccus isoporae]
MSRYARQLAVPGMDQAKQDRLRAGSVLIVGAGGLAAPVLQYLAAAGVGHLRLVDPDRVELSNLHRQTLFRRSDLGQPKAVAAARALEGLNEDCRIEPLIMSLSPGSIAALTRGVTLVLDCADSFAVSYMLSDHCLEAGLPFISASVVGTDGSAGGFCGGAPSLRAVFPDLPQRLGSCAEDGVLGPVVGVIGGFQAQMALAVLAGLTPSPLGRMLTYDGLAQRAGGFSFIGAAEPAWRPRFIDASAIAPRDFVVDLRAPSEGPIAHPDARRLTVDRFGPDGPRPAAGQRAVFCCRSGQRAWTAAERLSAVWDGEIALIALGEQSPSD